MRYVPLGSSLMVCSTLLLGSAVAFCHRSKKGHVVRASSFVSSFPAFVFTVNPVFFHSERLAVDR